ncbi:2-oxo acid dehydrogenase subunit E2 [Brevibacillus sp. WF146]|uniref:dihydrolipoamide acetyltransferase family protein n=1 Tax=Brevibacillus sp. WF146 TaxID=319501 RepID=UPI0007EDD6C0|nr:dihydrolipoamide acetyltransferase family protein [Brevibacillus sp. WF146]UYZ12259.1 2-oxo acid dehydrogenase subunit E2 [Brevibacillus sp. WF146]
MATGVFMPKLSMTMETGTIIQWFKEPGDDVKEGDVLLEVMTDKINIEVESYATGKLLAVYYGPDEVVPVNQVIGYIGEAGEQVPDAPPPLGGQAEEDRLNRGGTWAGSGQGKGRQAVDAGEGGAADHVADAADDKSDGPEKVRATPVARRMAREHDIVLGEIAGSGPRGRVQKADVEASLTARAAEPVIRSSVDTADSASGAPAKRSLSDGTPASPDPSDRRELRGTTRVKLDGMRKVIARRMVASAFSAPHVTLTTEADMSEAVGLRASLLPLVEKRTGLRLSYTEIIVKAVAAALALHPQVNASLVDDHILCHEEINVGLAVAVSNGLLVPVVKQANRRSLAELTLECKRLSALAREGNLLPDDLRGGTFTVSNLGMYAVDAFTPIINQPESAILGVGRIVEKPVGVAGRIDLRPMMSLSLSFDHRVMDGAPAAAFLQEVKELLESPALMLV